jgi:hypothetical protein
MDNILDIDNLDKITKLSEEELDLLYAYLDIELDNMSDEDKVIWYEILNKLDPDE